jgi:predicted ferric reductase
MSSRLKAAILVILGTGGVVLPVLVWAQYAYLAEFFWPDSLREYAQILSLVAFVLLFYQFALSGRSRVVEGAIGLDRLISTHRWLGVVAVALLLLHAVLITVGELVMGALSFSAGKVVGIVALLLLIVAAATAILWKTIGWSYEQWKKVHYANYVVLPASLLHALLLGSTVRRSTLMRYYLIALTVLFALIVLVRIVKRIRAHQNPFTISSVVKESHDVTSLYLEGEHSGFLPGQFMLVNIGGDNGYSEQHPYTISSSPTEPLLRISAKASGDFSGALSQVSEGTTALVEAPYGVFSYLSVPSDKLVFLAGGIGITPFLSQLAHMRANGTQKSVRLIWGNKTRADLAFGDELEAAGQALSDFAVTNVLSNEEWDGEKGFITADLISRHVEQPTEWHYMVCGPPVMMKMVFKDLKKLGVPSAHIHHERFALG